jgi:hypothetical protein
MGCPSEVIIGDNLVFSINTHNASTKAAADADSNPTYRLYEDETSTAILSGSMAKLDDANTLGFYSELVACTSANGFEAEKTYTIYISATVNSTTGTISFGFKAKAADASVTATTGALTSTANFKTYAGITSSDDDTLIGYLISRATSAIERYCDRTLRSATYREFYDGTGTNDLTLKEYPISAVTLLSTSRQDALRLININSDAYNAYVTVDSTSIYLVVQGGTNAGTDTLTLADYTITELTAAINALGTGWTAYNDDTTVGYWESAELLPCDGLEALSSNTYIQIPYEPIHDFKLYENQGAIYYSGGFPMGHQNITVRYTAGYATTPADLEQICIDLVNVYYRSRERDTSVKSEKLGDHSITFIDGGAGGARDIPSHIAKRLAPYMKWRLAC